MPLSAVLTTFKRLMKYRKLDSKENLFNFKTSFKLRDASFDLSAKFTTKQ